MNAVRFFALLAVIGILIGGVSGLIYGWFQSGEEPETSQTAQAEKTESTVSDETDTGTEPEPESPPQQEPDPTPATGGEATPPNRMTAEEAASIILDQVGGGSIKKIKLKEKDGRQIYKVEVRGGDIKKGKFEIDAYTGEILEADIDRKD